MKIVKTTNDYIESVIYADKKTIRLHFIFFGVCWQPKQYFGVELVIPYLFRYVMYWGEFKV